MITIYKYNSNDVRAVIQPSQSDVQKCKIMGEDIVSLNFSLPLHVAFSVGDYANIFGNRYEINIMPECTKFADRNYEYKLTLEAEYYNVLGTTQFLFLNANNHFTEAKFPMRGRAIDFCSLLLANINQNHSGWQLGLIIDSDYKDLEFDGENCLAVLTKLANTFNTEFLIENGKIHFYKKEKNPALVFKRGKNEALTSISGSPATDADIVTRLYAFGNNKNIGNKYRFGAQRLKMGETIYLEKNTDKYGIRERSIVFEDVYPHRVGTVSAVTTPFVFEDDSMDFDINDVLMTGISAKVIFNTGQLAGYTFEISQYNQAAKTFTILKNEDEQTLSIPSNDLKPAVGDQYVIVDILMPEAYILAAEYELRSKAIKYLDEHNHVEMAYQLTANPLYFKKNGIELTLSQRIVVEDEAMGLNVYKRITGFTRSLRTPSWYTSIELADVPAQPFIVKLINAIP